MSSQRSSWRHVFPRLSCQLPNLRTVGLNGTFAIDERSEIILDESHEIALLTKNCFNPFRDALEKYILGGGSWPSGAHSNPAETRVCSEIEGYVRSGLPEDNTMPDDPVREYEAHDIDSHFDNNFVRE